ncbi:transposase [Streptomyces pimonensis]|uniref:Mutator family transposase n=1 Tax=Streptomyces pimonensis TaxID=2860288 RepID=A0ABV4J329_9ACTN
MENRGVRDVLMLVRDGPKEPPTAVNDVWPRTVIRTCVVHLLQNIFRYAGRQDRQEMAENLKPICTPQAGAAAIERFAKFREE